MAHITPDLFGLEQLLNRRNPIMKHILSLLTLSLILSRDCIPTALAAETGAPAKSEILWGTEEQGSGTNSARQGGVSKADFATT